MECLRRALHLCPPEYRDVPLNNLANILYRWGRIDDALVIMKDALNISDFEVGIETVEMLESWRWVPC